MRFKADIILRLDQSIIKALDARRLQDITEDASDLKPRSVLMRRALTELLDREYPDWRKIHGMSE